MLLGSIPLNPGEPNGMGTLSLGSQEKMFPEVAVADKFPMPFGHTAFADKAKVIGSFVNKSLAV